MASVKISAYLDIYSKIITLVELFDKRTSDLVCCLANQVKKVPQNVIAIYDRAYGSQVLAYFHNLYGSKYVIRLKIDFSNTIRKFIESTDNERYITEPLTEKAYKRLEKYGIRKSDLDMISYRIVKVILSTGETEVLMTNLDKIFTISDLSELYHLRWGIETCFFCLKSCQMLGIFSGYSELAVKQDIFINLIFYNLQTIVQIGADAKAKAISEKRKSNPSKNKKKKNQGYKVNRNVGINTVRMHIKSLFTSPEKELKNLFKNIEKQLLLSLEIVKITHKERQRKMLRQNDRHITELNYKAGF